MLNGRTMACHTLELIALANTPVNRQARCCSDRLGLAVGGLALAGVIVFLILDSQLYLSWTTVLWLVVGGIFIIGLAIRFVRAQPGNRLRETFGPIVDAGDVYQKHLLGRPTGSESLYEASKYVPRDRYSSEE